MVSDDNFAWLSYQLIYSEMLLPFPVQNKLLLLNSYYYFNINHDKHLQHSMSFQAHVKRPSGRTGTPLMRPMSASTGS